MKFPNEQEKLFVQETLFLDTATHFFFLVLQEKTCSIFGNEKLMVKSGRYCAHVCYLTSFTEDEEEKELSGAASVMATAIWHCWMCFLTSVFSGQWQLLGFSHWTLQSFATLQQILVDHSEEEMGSVKAFTFSPSAIRLHHQKKTLVGPTFPSPESYMAYLQQSYLSLYFLATTMWPTFH